MNPEGKFSAPISKAQPQESLSVPSVPIATEELLDTFGRTHDLSFASDLTPAQHETVYNQLHSLAEKFDNQAMLVAWEHGQVPTFASMERTVNQILSHFENDLEDPEIGPLLKLLSQRVKEIRRWCSKYEQSILVFHRKKKARNLVGNSEGPAEFEKADRERRTIHENLMASIRSLDETVQKLDTVETLPKTFLRWEPHQSLPENYAHEHSLIFNAKVVTNQNRDLIRDWAIVANLEQKMEAQRAFFTQQEN